MANVYLKHEDIFRNISNISKKENGSWTSKKPVINFYTKVNGEWVLGVSESHTYYKYGGWIETTPDPAENVLEIVGSVAVSAETCEYVSLYNTATNVTTLSTWSIVNGSSYASIGENTGVVTVLEGASDSSVTIQAVYNGLTAMTTVLLTYVSGASSETHTETETDESGYTTTTTTIITTNEDGSSQENTSTITTDSSGNTIGSSETEIITSSGGSYNGTTINYDENGTPVDGTNTTGDTDGNVDTQEVVYDESGNSTVISYTIDTSGSTTGEKNITGNGVDTEFVPFDGSSKGFECHIRFKSIPSEQPNPPLVEDTEDKGSNYLFNIFSAQDPYRPWGGVMIRWALPKTNYTSSNGRLIMQYVNSNGSATNVVITSANSSRASTGLFDFTITYDPNLTKYNKKLIITDNMESTSLKSVDVTFGDNDMDFTLGYAISQAGTPYRYANVTIYDFSINAL